MNDRNLLDADDHLVLAKLRLKPLTFLPFAALMVNPENGRPFIADFVEARTT